MRLYIPLTSFRETARPACRDVPLARLLRVHCRVCRLTLGRRAGRTSLHSPARPQDRWRGYISSLTSLPIRGGASPKRVVAASHAVMKRKVPTFLPLATSIIAVPAVGRSAKG